MGDIRFLELGTRGDETKTRIKGDDLGLGVEIDMIMVRQRFQHKVQQRGSHALSAKGTQDGKAFKLPALVCFPPAGGPNGLVPKQSQDMGGAGIEFIHLDGFVHILSNDEYFPPNRKGLRQF